MKVTRISHKWIDKDTINPSQRAYDSSDRGVTPSVVTLSKSRT